MVVKGLEKLSLLDYPQKVSCTLFLFGCNFRCPFCHNPSLVIKEDDYKIDLDELFKFLEKRKGLLDAVVISGGEPLLYDLEDLIRRIKSMGFLLKIDTNGSNPLRLKRLIEKKLVDYVAMDLKNSFKKYEEIIGTEIDITLVKESVSLLKRLPNYELRTTLIKNFHSMEDIIEMSTIARDAPLYALQKFRKGTLLGNYNGIKLQSFSEDEYQEILNEAKKYNKNIILRG